MSILLPPYGPPAPQPLLQIGTLDLSPYLNVQQGGGMDPAAATFSNRIFSHALLKEGGVLALENVQLKEMIFPLRLHATTRPGVAALVENINQMITTPGQTAVWQDQGASSQTIFDLASGQFDVDYDFRKAGNYWIEGKLRLFAQPFGRTAGPRVIATAAGTGPLLTVGWSAGAVKGDAPALLLAQVQTGSQAQATGRQLGVSVLPATSSYVPMWLAASIVGNTGLVGGSGAVASQFLRLGPVTETNLTLANTQALPYLGDTRILAVARVPGGGTSFLHSFDAYNNPGPTVMLSATDWSFLDLGVSSVPSSLGGSQAFRCFVQVVGGATADITALLTLPDSQTVFVNDTNNQTRWPYSPQEMYTFDGKGRSITRSNATMSTALAELSSAQRGSIPPVPVSAQQLAVFNLPVAGGAANDLLSATVSVTERVRFDFG